MIYLDHNSTTPLHPRVLEIMLPYLREKWGNASSRDHAFGWDAQDAVEDARFKVSGLIGADASEIVFTSGATESIALAIEGLFTGTRPSVRGTLASEVEHDAVLGTCRRLNQRGIPMRLVRVDECGRLNQGGFAETLESHPPNVACIMAANHETGSVFPVEELAAAAHGHDALLFTDATQAVGKIPLDARKDGFDLAAFSAHKFNGPKGVGALFIRGNKAGLRLEATVPGGGQERGLRGGTLNVPGIVGFGEACQLVQEHLDEDVTRMRNLRDRLEEGVLSQVPDTWVNGDVAHRLCNTSNIGFRDVDARTMIRDMHDIAVSTRSACSSGNSGPSHVLKAIGLSDEDAYSCIRFSLGRFTTQDEIDYAIDKVVASAHKLRRNKSVRM